MSEYIEIAASEGRFKCYLAMPDRLPAPAIVVVQEIFGINRDLRETCDEMAAQGYVAASPDLFWRMEPDVEMNALDDAEWARAFALYSSFDLDAGVRDIAATMGQVGRHTGCNGQVGLMGYCLGGLMTWLTTARMGTLASVAYYPGAIDKYLGEAEKIRSPLMIHLGEKDEYISPSGQRAVADAVQDNDLVQVWTYSGQCHAFARHNGTHYDKASAELANGRTAEFFKRHLRRAGA